MFTILTSYINCRYSSAFTNKTSFNLPDKHWNVIHGFIVIGCSNQFGTLLFLACILCLRTSKSEKENGTLINLPNKLKFRQTFLLLIFFSLSLIFYATTEATIGNFLSNLVVKFSGWTARDPLHQLAPRIKYNKT